MRDENLKEEIEKEKSKKETPFWSILLIAVSLLHGLFIFRFTGYLTAHSGGTVGEMTEHLVGGGLMLFGIIKAFSLYAGWELVKKVSIFALSFIWTGLLFVSLVYSFGVGSPNPAWYFYAMVVFSCFRVSFKGGN